ncbi:MAG: YggT family protein [Cellvibrionaceae bacterium]
MNALSDISTFLVHSLATLYLLVVLLRFLLQQARADFYNPVSQFTVKATNPLLFPLRRIIPGFAGIDFASVALALLLQLATIELMCLLSGFGLINPLTALMWGLLGCLGLILNIYFFGLLVLIIVSWVAPQTHNPALILLQQLIEPAMAPFRKLIPPLGGLDITPIFAFLAINVGKIILSHLNQAAGLMGNLVYLVPGA